MTKAYTELINEPVIWLKQAYGNGIALGFEGPEDFIMKNHNLFCSFDFNDKSNKPLPNLIRVSDTLFFIYLTEERLFKALKLYFHVRALYDNDVTKYSTWDEENGIYQIIEDVEAADKISTEMTLKFINEFIQVKSFVPNFSSTDIVDNYLVAA